MPVIDLIEKGELYKCGPEDGIRDVVRKMEQNNVGAILVVDNERPVGMITDRDIALRCFGDGASRGAVSVKDIMTPSVECVSQDAGVQDVLRVMKDRQIRRIPVVDADGKAVGLLSSDDLIRLIAKEMGDLTEAIVHQGPIGKQGSGLKSA